MESITLEQVILTWWWKHCVYRLRSTSYIGRIDTSKTHRLDLQKKSNLYAVLGLANRQTHLIG